MIKSFPDSASAVIRCRTKTGVDAAIVDMLIRSGDIRDQSRKLSLSRKILGDLLAVTNFWEMAL